MIIVSERVNYHSHWSLQSFNDQNRNGHYDVMTKIYKLNLYEKENVKLPKPTLQRKKKAIPSRNDNLLELKHNNQPGQTRYMCSKFYFPIITSLFVHVSLGISLCRYHLRSTEKVDCSKGDLRINYFSIYWHIFELVS